MTDNIKIIAEPQMQGNLCKFSLEKPITEDGSFRFESKEEAQGSKIAEVLFNIEKIKSLFVSSNSILVEVEGMADWRTIGKDIGQAIREAVSSGEALINSKLVDELPSEDEIRKEVQDILEKEINPAVAAHGGVIELLDVKKNDVFVKMGGGCQGCASSTATLKQGVESSIRKRLPKIGAIYDTTDHAAGMNPYFAG